MQWCTGVALEDRLGVQARVLALGQHSGLSFGDALPGSLGPGQIPFHIWAMLFWLPVEEFGQDDFRALETHSFDGMGQVEEAEGTGVTKQGGGFKPIGIGVLCYEVIYN